MVDGPHRTGVAPRWADIAVLTRRNADIAAAVRGADRARRAGRDRRAGRAAAPARGDGRDGHPAAGRRRHRQPGPDPAAHRSALADRAPRPGPARPAGPQLARDRGAARRPADAATTTRSACWTPWSRPSPTSTRPRWSACSTPWRTRATAPYSDAARQRFAAAGGRARLPAPAQRRAGAGPDPPGDRHARVWTSSCWPPRSSPGAARRDQLGRVPGRGGRLRRRGRRGVADRAAGLPAGRDRAGHRARPGGAVGPRGGEAADRAQGQGPGVGGRCSCPP